MFINLTKAFIDENQHDLKNKPWNIEARNRYNRAEKIDLRDYKKEDLEELRKLAISSNAYGSKNVVKDIDNYLQLFTETGIKEVKARTVNQQCGLLIEYISRYSKKRWVFEKLEDESGVTVAYYIESIEFVEAVKERGGWYQPEYVNMKLTYMEIGELKHCSVQFHIKDCLGATAREALQNVGLLFDRKSLQEEYEENLEKWNQEYDKIGKQFLCAGSGTGEGVEGNNRDDWEDDDDTEWYSKKNKSIDYDKLGDMGRVLIDVFKESEQKNKIDLKGKMPNPWFWKNNKRISKGGFDSKGQLKEAEWDEEDEFNEEINVEVPIHPYVVIFDLQRHLRMKTHIGNLHEYKYDESIMEKLVMPEANEKLISVLLESDKSQFKDIIRGKTGGLIVLCQGPPGTGKTLTAEVYAESKKRPLYTVQCSQLGTDPDELEKNLMKILKRGKRWKAVTLLDEADVYVHERGNDLVQNAIVGVFLRVLEYHAGTLFLTTNRGDLVDDAILSRCTARIPYQVPDELHQHKIWAVLSETNNIELSKKTIHKIVDKHPHLSGRDIKNLLKLASIVAQDRGVEIDEELITEMKIFKPTSDQDYETI